MPPFEPTRQQPDMPLLPLTAEEWLKLGSYIQRLGPTLCGAVTFDTEEITA